MEKEYTFTSIYVCKNGEHKERTYTQKKKLKGGISGPVRRQYTPEEIARVLELDKIYII